MSEKKYCALTHTGVYVINNGNALPCCASRMLALGGSLPTDTPILETLEHRLNVGVIKRIRKQLIDGIWPTECNVCKIAEERGITSMRQAFNELIPEPATLRTELKLEDVQTLHLGVGNKCNSKCMTCEPHSSDQWIDEFQFIHGKPYTRKFFPLLERTGGTELLADSLPNIKRITFLGGEPTISDKYQTMLNAFIKSGRSKDIDLGFVTNLTTVDTVIDYWLKFKSVDISVSIDGCGKINEYIRYPIKWEKTLSNLKSLLKHFDNGTFRVGLSLTPSVYNCLHLDELLKFWCDITSEFNARQIISLNKVTYPINASMRVMPLEYRNIGVEKLLKFKQTTNDDFIHSVIGALISELKEPVIDDQHTHLNNLKHFISKSDQYRNRTIKDYIPELYEALFLSTIV